MDDWERFNEAELPPKKEFYSKLNLEDITDEDYKHAAKVRHTFNIKNIGEHHDLYVQSDTLLLADPAHFLSLPGLAWQACLKKTQVKLELLTNTDMLLMIEAGIRGGISQAIHRYATTNNKYMKAYNKNIKSSYLMYLNANNLYGLEMCKKVTVK